MIRDCEEIFLSLSACSVKFGRFTCPKNGSDRVNGEFLGALEKFLQQGGKTYQF